MTGNRQTHALIGRDHPAGVLRAEIGRAADSHGGLVLVTGEAGIGKSTLVAGAAEDARRLGALVLSGSCWDSENAPGYWPWVQVLRGLRRAAAGAEWAAAEEAAGGGLAVLLGEARGTEGVESFQLYDAVTSALVSVSQTRPVVVVLDDLHWADTASLRLLEFAAQHTWFERVLLVGTYRDVEVEPDDHPLRPLIMPLLARATTVTLTGLAPDEVGALMARTAGEEPDPALAAEVHRRTGGNPFFVEQTARLWRSGGTVTGVAPGVRDALRRRLSLLPAPVERLLTDAAVLGREFHRRVLAAAAGAPVPQVDRLLEQAVAARLVVAHGAGRFAFAHDLVRETLYGALDDTGEDGRAERHAAVVRALEGDAVPAGHVGPADLAHHARLAGDTLEPSRAVDHLLAAARDAGVRLAFEESIGHLWSALERAAQDEPRRHVVIGLDLGVELHARGEWQQSSRVLREAVERARALDDDELLARVALTLHRLGWRGETDQRLAGELVVEAHRRLVRDVPGEGGPYGREGRPGAQGGRTAGAGGAAGAGGRAARAEAAGAELDGPQLERLARELAVRAVVLARRGEDDEALSFSLWSRHDLMWGPGTAAEREALTEEMIAVARRASDDETERIAVSLSWVALLEQGDPRYLERFHAFVTMAEQDAGERMRMAAAMDRCIIAALGARFEEAEARFAEAVGAGDHHEDEHPGFAFVTDHVYWSMLLAQGRFDELDATHRRLVERGHPNPQLVAGITAAERGDVDGALRRLAEVSARPESLSRSEESLWLRFQAQAAAVSRDPELCERARRAIAPYADEWAVSFYGCDISGPMAYWLGRLDAAQERWDEAVDEFTAAAESADRLRAVVWAVTARAHLGEALLARGAPGDADAAAALLEDAEREAVAVGMRHVAERARQARLAPAPPPAVRVADGPDAPYAAREESDTARGGAVRGEAGPVREDAVRGGAVRGAPGAVSGPAAGAQEEAPAREFRREGAVWTLRLGGRTVHMPDAKGLRDLHTLLANPGTDIPAVRLLDPEGGELVVAARQLGGDDVLDEEAKARYKKRLTQLDQEIDRAVERGDDRRAADYDREREALLHELRAAAGLGGRSRRLGDEAERARKTVTARIRDTLRKLDERHPELAAHLRATVSTGAACRYQPDSGTGWRL
ncbi:ATPase [Streptomyces armeniacus]|uniref:ATPase n=1 Tax=Streptomyces armeniacus TaxID=83291 RepID=A0A345XXJ3_9ACTN|nr:AAA family ATPase [Streptomyces armeniacus]AXK36359.1 ATPase [Streptomyces armeniacus]